VLALTHDEKQRFKPHSSAWQDFNEFLAQLMPGDVWIVKVLRQKTLLRFELLECSSTVSCPDLAPASAILIFAHYSLKCNPCHHARHVRVFIDAALFG
jgi:hypothetical protein